jgi:hypothetical protein
MLAAHMPAMLGSMTKTANRVTRHVTSAPAAPDREASPISPDHAGDASAAEARTVVKPPSVAAGTQEAAEEPTPQLPPAAVHASEAPDNARLQTSAEASPAEVLITEQQVMFSTAAASLRREHRHPFLAVLRLFATSTAESRSRPRHDVPRRMYYLEQGRMGREMDRL